ncbi:MAG: T9SS type A sorting domain-containing protein [Ignavibacteria bacterium]|nr:T9SS type A sorting domain-containing protein [Ignavibacteria bacterium]
MKKFAIVLFFSLCSLVVSAQALSGDYYIPKGTHSTGYTTLAEAITAFNTNGANGAVRFLIDGDLTETGANLSIIRNDLTATNNLTIKPNTGKTPVITISGASSAAGNPQYAGLTIDNTSYVTIDGSNTANGKTRDLTFAMNDSLNGRIGINLFGNDDFITLKNFVIKFVKVNITNISTRGIYANGQATGVVDSLVIDNCKIGDENVQPAYAVSITGSSGSSIYCSKVYVRNNQCFSTLRRIYFYIVGQAGSNCEISGNTIAGTQPALYGNVVWGVLLNTYNGPINIYKNKLHMLRDTTNANNGMYGLGTLSSGAAGTLTIYNNFFGGDFQFTGSGTLASCDIISLQDTSRNNKIYYNTIVLNNVGKSSTTRLSCIRLGVGTLELKNNIFYTNYTDTMATLVRVDGGTLTSDYNDFYTTNSTANVGYYGGQKIKTIDAWKTATSQDAHSVSIDPKLTSMTDFHIAATPAPLLGLGVKLASVSDDIDGDARKNVPDIGGDEQAQQVPVELINFSAKSTAKTVTLEWATATEKDNRGYEVLRNSGKGWESISFVKGHGSTTQKSVYSYTDANVAFSSAAYKLKQVNFDGTYTYTNEINVVVGAPSEFAVGQNYPNPFNPTTMISYSVPMNGNVRVEVFNMLGQKVRTLVDEQKAAGHYEVVFNAGNLASGQYIYSVSFGGKTITKKFTIMK